MTNREFNTEETMQSGEELDLMGIIIPYLRFWPTYIISIIICLGLAWLFGATQRTKYPISSTVLFLDDSKNGKSAGSAIEAMNIMDLASGTMSVNIDNEIQLMKSRGIVQLAVLESGDYIDVTSKDGLRTQVWFKDLPFDISMVPTKDLDDKDSPLKLKVKSLGNEKYEIIDEESEKTSKIESLPFVYATEYGLITFSKSDSKTNSPNSSTYKITISSPLQKAIGYAEHGLLSVEKNQKAGSVARLRIESDNRQKGEFFLSKLLEVYNRERAIDKDASAQNTYNFINERIEIIGKELSDVEGRLENVKKSQGVTSYEDLGVVVSSSMNIQNQEAEARTQLQLVDYLLKYMGQMDNDNYNLIPGSISFKDVALQTSTQLYNQLIFQRNSLASSVNNEHPRLEALDSDIQKSRANILEAAKVAKNTLEIQLRGLQKQGNSLSNKISDAPTFERIATDIERQRSIRSQLYLMLLTKREETSIQLAASLESARMVDTPLASETPSAPKKPVFYLIGLIFGVALPTLAIYLWLWTKTKVEDEEDIRKATNLSLVGIVPKLDKDTENEIVVQTHGSDEMTEVFRTIRTNLNFQTQNKHPLTIICTSTQSGEGKTFIASNLAVSLSALDQKVLLVGLDIRNPQLKRTFKLTDHHKDTEMIGMTDILNDVTLDPMSLVCRHQEYPNLSLLLSGKIPPNPAELLARPRLDQVFAVFKEHFDYIIVDCAPCGPIVDTLVLSRVADATLYTVRANKTEKNDFGYINYLADENKLPNVSLVLNGIELKDSIFRRSYGYGYGYGHKYGYGYGYGQPTKKK